MIRAVPANPAKPTAADPDLTQYEPTDPLSGFVPRWLASSRANLTDRPLVPAIAAFPSAAVFADISGFSQLTQLFADQGADGVERLTRIVDVFLGQLLDTVARWGGDVEDLYGDGILAFWPAESREAPPVALA